MNRRLIVSELLLLCAALGGCGGGGASSNPEASTPAPPSPPPPPPPPPSPPAPPESTALIASYFSAQHTSQRNLFASDEDSLSSSLSASGLYRSGTHYSRSQTNYENRIAVFLESALAYVQQAARSMPIDKPAIIELLQQHLSTDTSYASTYYSSVNWGLSGSGLTSFIEGVQANVQQAYSLTIAQVQVV
jgi:hypothetical protein